MNEGQDRFLKDEFFSLTLMATVQRAGIYDEGAGTAARRSFQADLKHQLEALAATYTGEVSEERHIQNITALSASLSADHAAVLRDGRFRIGPAQKALNLYLKYLWCLGKIARPPHCPFDSLVIGELAPEYRRPSWTALDTEPAYRRLVRAAKDEAGGQPLALWELETYNRARARKPRPAESPVRRRAPARLRKQATT